MPLPGLPARAYELKVALPEGAGVTSVAHDVPLLWGGARVTTATRWRFLDRLSLFGGGGSPVVILRAARVVSGSEQLDVAHGHGGGNGTRGGGGGALRITYTLPLYAPWDKLVYAGLGVLAVMAVVALLARLDLSSGGRRGGGPRAGQKTD